ncbi:MAG: murein DD-endopeptidase MepM/ murein hydrolase activator NlpD [Psychromonas sp.]|jgi:murein DD-endopeptidase MepM/ murein hydrolase activator NlpD
MNIFFNLSLIFVQQFWAFLYPLKPQNVVYHSPLNIPLVLAANFGELRNNHYHTGLDFKTNHNIGYNLYSIDEGYIARVNVSPYGYGKAVYINHPGGLTSVYAHCSEFKGVLAEKIKNIQLESKNSEVEIYFQPNEIKVQKGDVFALSGNTGGSTAPHLHFEIRDTYTEEALNPLNFGFDIQDHKSPILRRLKIYALDKHGFLVPGKEKEYNLSKSDLDFNLPANFCPSDGKIGVAIDGSDYFDAANNSCGLYRIELISKKDTLYKQQIDRIGFDVSRYINIQTDYLAFKQGRKYYKCFFNSLNPLKIFDESKNGQIVPKKGLKQNFTLKVSDVQNNSTSIRFSLTLDGLNSEYSFLESGFLNPNEPQQFKSDNGVVIDFPAMCTYEPYMPTVKYNYPSTRILSSQIPVQNALLITIPPLTGVDVKKQYITVDQNRRSRPLITTIKKGNLVAESKFFGEFNIGIDTTAPSISYFSNRSNSNITYCTWNLNENESGLASYRAFINEKWQILDYDYKTNRVTLSTNEKFKSGSIIRIEAEDNCGNVQTKTYNL